VIIDRLIEAIEEKQNPAAAGLDTRLEHIPPSFRSQWDAAEPAGAAAAATPKPVRTCQKLPFIVAPLSP
jgi:hypothetical protein